MKGQDVVGLVDALDGRIGERVGLAQALQGAIDRRCTRRSVVIVVDADVVSLGRRRDRELSELSGKDHVETADRHLRQSLGVVKARRKEVVS